MAPPTSEVTVMTPAQEAAVVLGAEVLEFEDPDAIAARINTQILDSDDPDVILGGVSTVPAAEMIGQPIRVTGYHLHRSDFGDDGPGAYMTIDALALNSPTGELVVITCGAKRVMIQLIALRKSNQLPQDVVIAELVAAKNGRSALLGLQAYRAPVAK